MNATVMNTICLSYESAYTRGWRACRDGISRDELAGASEFAGWDDADAAIRSGRDISWSRKTDGQFVFPEARR